MRLQLFTQSQDWQQSSSHDLFWFCIFQMWQQSSTFKHIFVFCQNFLLIGTHPPFITWKSGCVRFPTKRTRQGFAHPRVHNRSWNQIIVKFRDIFLSPVSQSCSFISHSTPRNFPQLLHAHLLWIHRYSWRTCDILPLASAYCHKQLDTHITEMPLGYYSLIRWRCRTCMIVTMDLPAPTCTSFLYNFGISWKQCRQCQAKSLLRIETLRTLNACTN